MRFGEVVGGMVAIALSFFLIGCDGSTSSGGQQPDTKVEEVQPKDSEVAAISNDEVAAVFNRALVARWKISNSQPNDSGSYADHQKNMISCIDAELEVLGELDSATYEDEEIVSIVNQYVKGLEDQKEQYVDYSKHPTLRLYNYSVINENVRKASLRSLVDKTGLSFGGDNKETFEGLLAEDATYVGKDVVNDIFLVSECRNFQYLYGNTYSCELKVTNTTNLPFEMVVFKVRFYDADGVQLYEDSRTQENVDADSTFWLPVTCDSTDTPTEVRLVGYELDETDPSGEYDYLLYDDTTTIDPQSFELI